MYGMNFYDSNENVINITFYKYKISLLPVTQLLQKLLLMVGISKVSPRSTSKAM